MRFLKLFFIMSLIFTVMGYAADTVLLPTVSRAPTATNFITTEFDRLMRQTAGELQMNLVPAEDTLKALDKYCISAEMPIYTAKRLQDTAASLGAQRMYRIVIQKFSVYSRYIRTAKSTSGDTFYFGHLQGTLQTISDKGFVVEARVFNVHFDSINKLPPAPGQKWSAKDVAMAMMQEALARQMPLIPKNTF